MKNGLLKFLACGPLAFVLVGGCLSPTDGTGPDEEGFETLFNGVDLTGWIGATNLYGVARDEPGVLQCFPGRKDAFRNLVTEREFGDFVLRFDVILPRNANNGLGVRMAGPGSWAAYGPDATCEIQLLDDGGDDYFDAATGKTKIRDYQYCGSIYGVVPARRDAKGVPFVDNAGNGSHLRPAGEWNAVEVTVRGSRIRVALNGVTVTDADVAAFKGDGSDTPDRKKHPGLNARRRGRIGWLGHDANAKWRNVRIREL